MSARWFNSVLDCITHAPGEWGDKEGGYLYGVFWVDGEIKIGSSVNPRQRIRESWSVKSSARIAISPKFQGYFNTELSLHKQLNPIHITGRREHYQPTDEVLRSLLVDFLGHPTDTEVLKQIGTRVSHIVVSDKSAVDFDPIKAPKFVRVAFSESDWNDAENMASDRYFKPDVARLFCDLFEEEQKRIQRKNRREQLKSSRHAQQSGGVS